jgi:DNA-binding CsgD family transcriptional regulator
MTNPPSALTSDREILEIYEDILPLLSYNPESIDFDEQINTHMRRFVRYDFFHVSMEQPTADLKERRLDSSLIRIKESPIQSKEFDISIHNKKSGANREHIEGAEETYQRMIEDHVARFPHERDFFYHRIESHTPPKIAIGYFRVKGRPGREEFTVTEIQRLNSVAPHIFTLYRLILTQTYHSQVFQYFNSFATIGSRIANDCGLSDAEIKILPDILYGYSVEEIAERQFVSPATIKTHINRILKKTGTKSRMDFIGRFFTSPERVEL